VIKTFSKTCIHQNNPDIITNPHDAPAEASHDEIWAKLKEAWVQSVKDAKSAPQTKCGKHEERMIVAKAIMMQKNEELVECEVVKEQLNMLKDFKSSFICRYNGDDGEKEYDVTVQDCLPIMKKQQAQQSVLEFLFVVIVLTCQMLI
jgi:hypothetical protein